MYITDKMFERGLEEGCKHCKPSCVQMSFKLEISSSPLPADYYS
jgi:hypothetical protein